MVETNERNVFMFHVTIENGKVDHCDASTPALCKMTKKVMHFEKKEDAKRFSKVQSKRKLEGGGLNKNYDGVVTMSENLANEIMNVLDRTGVNFESGFVEHLTRLPDYHGDRMEWTERGYNMRYVFTSNRFGDIRRFSAYPLDDRYATDADYDNCIIVEREVTQLLECE